jgi:hypothetical protein
MFSDIAKGVLTVFPLNQVWASCRTNRPPLAYKDIQLSEFADSAIKRTAASRCYFLMQRPIASFCNAEDHFEI